MTDENKADQMKAVFLDRDGTINIDHGYVHKVKDFEFIEGAVEGLKKLQSAGFAMFIITDQSGIGRGYYTMEDFEDVSRHLSAELKAHDINIKKTYYCPHSPEDNCECRKPNIKMLLDAKKDFGIELKNSYLIGDKESDILTGKRAGCRTVLVLSGHIKDPGDCKTRPDLIAKDLKEAAELIIKEHK